MSTTPLAIEVPRVPVGDTIERFFDWLTETLGAFFDAISDGLDSVVDGFIGLLQTPDPVVMAVIFALVGVLVGGWRLGLISIVGLLFIIGVEQWAAAMQTLALVLVSTVVAVILAIPLGIWAASSRRASAVLRPIMDLMQTMPAFVWLVPVVTLFSIGVVPGVVATIIFALPPGVRLTELGIRNVDHEIVEASHAFGSTPRQTLFGVQLPLALPTIMAGVNQVIMLALSMAVIAGLVGAEGLGGEVTGAIATLNIGLGFEAGLSVVVLAIYLDRVTASIGHSKGLLGRLRRTRRPAAEEEPASDEPGEGEEPAVPDDMRLKIGA